MILVTPTPRKKFLLCPLDAQKIAVEATASMLVLVPMNCALSEERLEAVEARNPLESVAALPLCLTAL